APPRAARGRGPALRGRPAGRGRGRRPRLPRGHRQVAPARRPRTLRRPDRRTGLTMEPRDDFERASASVRRRAADLGRRHDADEVTRLARRRRTWQGATAGLTVLAVVGVSVAAL